MLNISRWSIRNPVATTLLFILLTTLGLLCFKALNVRNMPDIDLPMVTVSIVYPGASPTTLESEVVNKVEGVLTTVAGVKHTSATIVDGVVAFVMEFPLGKNVQEALEDTRSAIAGVRAQLPPEVREPIIAQHDISKQTLLAYAVHSNVRDDIALSQWLEDVVRPRLALVSQVSRVSLTGLVRRELRVDLQPEAIAALGISATEVSRQLKRAYSNNVAGMALLGQREQQIRVLARVDDPLDIGQLRIPLNDGRTVRLHDIADIYDGAADRTSAAFLNGQPMMGFELAQAKKGDQLQFRARVEKTLAQLQQEYPDIEFSKTLDFVEVAQGSYEGSQKLLAEGIFLTITVVWFFLRNGRATLISAFSLPMSIIPAFIGMLALGFTINVISVLAIILVIGVLVDDTIVEIENITRHMDMGKTPLQAALDATDEIGLAVVATTFTIVAVFFPTAFMGGIGGLFFRQFGLTVVFAVLASLVVARMLTPMLAAYCLKAHPHKAKTAKSAEPRWLAVYMRLSHWCVQHRFITLLCTLGFFLASLALLPLLPKGFIPADNNTYTQVTLEMPPGTRFTEQVAVVRQAQHKLSDIAEIEQIYATLGSSSSGEGFIGVGHGTGTRASLTLKLAPRKQRRSKVAIQSSIVEKLADLPGVRVNVGLGVSNDKYQMHLVSDDKAALQQAASALEPQIRGIAGIHGVQAGSHVQRTEVAVEMDFARAADLGITASDVAHTLRLATVGDYEEYLPKFDEEKRQIPIRIKLNDRLRSDLTALENLLIPSSHAGPVRLKEVARLSLASGPVSLRRLDGQHSAGFTVSIGNINMGDLTQQVAQLPAIQHLPPGVQFKETGDSEARAELFTSFASAMLIGALLIYAVLVLLFRDFLQPVTLLVSLPLATGGSFVAMLLTGKSFSLPTMIGFIMLMGIVTKNSILLVDYAIMAQKDQGMERLDAVLDACHKRARPIVMTSLAMGFGMLPIALGLGNSDMSFSSPMGVTLVGGLVTSTLLSLIVVPVMFICADDVRQWLKRRMGKR